MSNTLAPRTAKVTIYQGDDMANLAELRQAVDVAERKHEKAKKAVDDALASGSLRIGDDLPEQYEDDLRAARSAYEAAVDEASERAVEVTLVAMKRKAFRDLMAAHPPRKDNEDDAQYGVNFDTFPPEFLAKSIAGPVGFDPEDLPDGEYEHVFAAGFYLNRLPGADPKAEISWRERPSSDVT